MNKDITYIFADFETTTGKASLVESHVYLGNWMFLDDDKEQDNFFFNVNEFFDSMIKKAPTNHLVIYFHNGGKFDTQFIMWWLIDTLHYSQCDKPSKAINKYFYCLEDVSKRFRLIFQYRGITFDLKDSYMLLMSPIKKLGKIYGLDKLQYNYDIVYKKDAKTKQDKENNKLALSYVHNDVAIGRRALMAHSKYWGGLGNLTIASTTYSPLIPLIKKFNLNMTYSQFNYFKQFYRGGYCCYKPQLANKWLSGHFYVYDINSSYPNAQCYPQPIGEPLKTPPKDKPFYKFLKIWIKSAKIKNREWMPCLPRLRGCESDNPTDYVYETTNQMFYVLSLELEWLLKFYDIKFEILDTWYFEVKSIFKKDIMDLYNKKVIARRNNNESELSLVKTGINAMYGKFGQKPIFESVYYLNDEELEEWKINGYQLIRARNDKSDIGDKKAYVMINPRDSENIDIKYVPIACAITSIARAYLLKAIWENKESIIYCDTDSMILNKKAVGIEVDNEKLGAWKLEAEGDEFNVLQAKFYRMYNNGEIIKSASAGVDKKVANAIPKNKFKLGMNVKLGKKQAVKVRGGIIIVEKDTIIGELKRKVNYSGNSNAIVNEEYL